MKQRIDFVSNSSSSSFMLDYESAPQEFRDNGCTYDFEGYFKNGYLKRDLISDIYSWSYPYGYRKPSKVLYRPSTVQYISDNFIGDMICGCYLEKDKNIVEEMDTIWQEITDTGIVNINTPKEISDHISELKRKINDLYNTIVKNVYEAIKDNFKDFCVCEVTGYDDKEINGESEEEYFGDICNRTSAKFSRSVSNH